MQYITKVKKTSDYIGIADMSGRHDNTLLKDIIVKSKDVQDNITNVKAKMTDWNLAEEYSLFKDLATDICETYVYDYLLEVYGNYKDTTSRQLVVSDMWGIVYQGNEIDHTVTHSHHWCHTSFVYYVDVGENTSPIIFDDYELEIQPKNSMLLLFDGRIKHHVPTYKGKKQRVVVGGNIDILKLNLYKRILNIK